MSKLFKQVEKVSCMAKSRTTKQVINDLMQIFCNLITEPAFIERVFPNTLYQFGPGFRLDLSYYKQDLKAWVELHVLAKMFMTEISNSEPFTDVIGQLYDLELKGNTMGQFLTPPDLADVLAMIQVAIKPQITGPTKIGDLTGCGAGTLVLSLIKAHFETQGKGAVSYLDVEALDADIHMVKMTTVQVVLNSCIHRIPLHSVVVHHANAITEYEEMKNDEKIAYLWMPATPDSYYNKFHKGTVEKQLVSTQEKEFELI